MSRFRLSPRVFRLFLGFFSRALRVDHRRRVVILRRVVNSQILILNPRVVVCARVVVARVLFVVRFHRGVAHRVSVRLRRGVDVAMRERARVVVGGARHRRARVEVCGARGWRRRERGISRRYPVHFKKKLWPLSSTTTKAGKFST